MTAAAAPSAPVLALDDFAWRFAGPADATALESIAAHGSNRVLFNLPRSVDEFAVRLSGAGLRFPMLCTRDSRPCGAAVLGTRSTRDLNAMISCFFIEPSESTLPLAAYVRHVFWMQPLHRLFAQLPIVEGTVDYVKLLVTVGFREEGVVAKHALIDEEPVDVAILGLLRREFERWCTEREPRLAL